MKVYIWSIEGSIICVIILSDTFNLLFNELSMSPSATSVDFHPPCLFRVVMSPPVWQTTINYVLHLLFNRGDKNRTLAIVAINVATSTYSHGLLNLNCASLITAVKKLGLSMGN
jgi:hypothetical protein